MRFPSDTISTHFIHPPGVAALKSWGLLGRLVATGCPPIDTYSYDFGTFTISGAPGTAAAPLAYAPRRTVLDKLLVDAAAEAGAEVRERFTVSGVVIEDGRVTGVRGHDKGGRTVTEHAQLVIGADGWRSLVARAVRPRLYNEKPRLLAGYYAYWSGLPTGGRVESHTRPGRAFAAWPTHDDLTLVMGSWPFAEFAANKSDIEGNVLAMLQLAPPFAERVRSATRQSRFVGTPCRTSSASPMDRVGRWSGPGYTKDFITGHGIHDAFRDADLCATALDETFSGARSFDVAMSGYHNARDEQVLPMYEFTTQLATLAPPPREQRQLLAAVHGDTEAWTRLQGPGRGDLASRFFSAENVARIFDRQRLRVG